MAKQTKPPAIILGDLIAGTALRRRFQDGIELCPVYEGIHHSLSEALDFAERQCNERGIRRFRIPGDPYSYGNYGGQWYYEYLPPGANGGEIKGRRG